MNEDDDASRNEPLLIEPARLTDVPTVLNHDTLKYHLLGPSLTKSGQDNVDQQKVCTLRLLRSCALSDAALN